MFVTRAHARDVRCGHGVLVLVLCARSRGARARVYVYVCMQGAFLLLLLYFSEYVLMFVTRAHARDVRCGHGVLVLVLCARSRGARARVCVCVCASCR